MSPKPVEIICTACGREALLVREPVYDGLRKTGEVLKCSACGHVYADEGEIHFKTGEAPKVFDESDREHRPEVFEAGETERLCRHCAHYVVNPFMQWCGVHHREVEATDTCDDFEPRPEDGDGDQLPGGKAPLLS